MAVMTERCETVRFHIQKAKQSQVTSVPLRDSAKAISCPMQAAATSSLEPKTPIATRRSALFMLMVQKIVMIHMARKMSVSIFIIMIG